MADVLVVGANGFIGSHVVDALVEAGHNVTAFDRFSTAHTSFVSDVRIVSGDFLNRGDVRSAVVGQDYVFHLLSTTTPASAESDPTLDIRANVAPTVELLEACAHAGVSHFYYGSTGGAIYGPQGHLEYSEADRALPVSPYGIGKLTVEHYLHYFRTRFGLPSTALRISNPYGPRQRPNRRQGLIPIALRQIASGHPVTQFGDGSMVRDYLYVADLVAMITRMVGVPAFHDLFNIGSGTGHSITEVFDALRRITARDFEIVPAPQPPTFVDHVVLDTTRYRETFGPIELTSLEDGIAHTWDDIRGVSHV